MIGKIVRVPLRNVWEHEARDFTQYLQKNLDVLNAVIDLNLVSAEPEQAAGSFSVDLLAEDESGGTVVIENQLEKSDHDHLGKLITYLAAFSAKAAIWVVPEARPEHVAAVAWLSESTSASFYLVKAEAIKIVSESGESDPALMMTLLLGPSAVTKEISKKKVEIAGRQSERHHFFQTLLLRAKDKTKLFSGITPGNDNWIGVTASPGKGFLSLNYVIEQRRTRAELYIDRGISAEDNEAIFDQFYTHRDEIEKACGHALHWERLDGKRACRIAWRLESGGYRSEEAEWPDIQDGLIDAMIRFAGALRPFMKELAVPAIPKSPPEDLVVADES